MYSIIIVLLEISSIGGKNNGNTYSDKRTTF